MVTCHALNAEFPHLAEQGYDETSPATPLYNCIAWAVGETDAWWWPTPEAVCYWPPGAPREETLGAISPGFCDGWIGP